MLATGSSQLVCNNPSYSWTPTYPTYNEGYNPLTNWGEPPHSCCDLRVCPNSRSRLSWKCGSFLVVYQNPGVSPTKKGYSYQQNNTWGHCSQFWDPSLRYGVKLGHFQNWMPLYQPSPWYPMVNTEIAGIYGCSSFIPQMEFQFWIHTQIWSDLRFVWKSGTAKNQWFILSRAPFSSSPQRLPSPLCQQLPPPRQRWKLKGYIMNRTSMRILMGCIYIYILMRSCAYWIQLNTCKIMYTNYV